MIERPFIEASNRLFDVLLFEERPGAILDSLARIVGETLDVDRALIYNVSFVDDTAEAMVEWLNPDVPDLAATKATYPLQLFRCTAEALRDSKHWLASHDDARHPSMIAEGSAAILHEEMQIRSLLWCPFSFRDDGYYALVFNSVRVRREGTTSELELVQAATRHVGMALLKIDLIRQRLRAEEELLAAQKLESLGVLAGGIAHDFNNLMVGVITNAELVAKRLPADSPLRPLVLETQHAGQRAADLASQLLAYAGKGPPGVAYVEPAAVVERTARLVHASMPDVHQELSLAPDLPKIECNVSQFEQVVMNLLINAAEALDERDKRVRVRLEAIDITEVTAATYHPIRPDAGHYIALSIEDDGIGMSPETVGKIFDPFFTTKPTGRGLGLSAVLGILRQHRGALQLESTLGRGTRFTVVFPVVSDTSGDVPEPSAPLASGGGRNILVIDDVPAVARAISTVLEDLGYRCIVATSGRDGLAQFRAHAQSIDCVLVDLTMPAPGGVEVLKQLRAWRPELPVVMMSGYSEIDVTSLRGPHTTFVKKPFLAGELDAALSGLLAVS